MSIRRLFAFEWRCDGCGATGEVTTDDLEDEPTLPRTCVACGEAPAWRRASRAERTRLTRQLSGDKFRAIDRRPIECPWWLLLVGIVLALASGLVWMWQWGHRLGACP